MLEKKLLLELQEYVDRYLIRVNFEIFESIHPNELEDFIRKTRKPIFNQVLFSFIDHKGATDLEVYKRAGMDRRHFSKIRSNPEYRPSKNTAIALAIALELNKEATEELLSSAGYSLSESETFDLVIQFCLEKKIYNLHDVNEALHHFHLKPLAGA